MRKTSTTILAMRGCLTPNIMNRCLTKVLTKTIAWQAPLSPTSPCTIRCTCTRWLRICQLCWHSRMASSPCLRSCSHQASSSFDLKAWERTLALPLWSRTFPTNIRFSIFLRKSTRISAIITTSCICPVILKVEPTKVMVLLTSLISRPSEDSMRCFTARSGEDSGLRRYFFCHNADLQPDICQTSGHQQFDRAFPELEGVKPQGEEVPTHYQEAEPADSQPD